MLFGSRYCSISGYWYFTERRFPTIRYEWISWSRLSNEIAYDYTRSRHLIKPGEKLFPTFGICDVLNIGKDVKNELLNKHRFVCEITPNVLYQYVFIVLWVLFVVSIVVSSTGLIMQIADYLITTAPFLSQGSQVKKVYQPGSNLTWMWISRICQKEKHICLR